jgi:hypothetical protein
MSCRCAARPSEILVPVIDSPVVEKPAIPSEHRCLRGDVHLARVDKSKFRVAQRREVVPEITQVLPDLFRRLRLDRIHQIERCVRFEPSTHLLNRWGVPIRDWTIGAHKKQHYNFSVGAPNRVDGSSIQIHHARAVTLCLSRRGAYSQRQEQSGSKNSQASRQFPGPLHTSEYNIGACTSSSGPRRHRLLPPINNSFSRHPRRHPNRLNFSVPFCRRPRCPLRVANS